MAGEQQRMTYTFESVSGAAKLRDDILASTDVGVAMFAVVQMKANEPFEFRTIDVIEDEQTRSFDMTLLSDALLEYTSEDISYTTFTNALDTRKAIAELHAADFPLPAQSGKPTADERAAALFPSFLNTLPTLFSMYDHNQLEPLSSGDFPHVKGILFSYQFGRSTLYGYQKTVRSSALQESSFLLKSLKGHAFRLFTDESIKIANHFDFVVIDGEIAAINPATLVNQFGLLEVRQKQAMKAVDIIGEYVNDLAPIIERVEKKRKRTITKILRIKESPVVSMDIHELRQKLESSEEYSGRFSFDDDDKIIIDNAETANAALKMLNDEIVKSPISNAVYESEIKERVK